MPRKPEHGTAMTPAERQAKKRTARLFLKEHAVSSLVLAAEILEACSPSPESPAGDALDLIRAALDSVRDL